MFITLEGLDGSGQSTQAALLARKLRRTGHRVTTTKEPTDDVVGKLIRRRLQGKWQTNMECLQLLFVADRAHHLEKVILPALKKGQVVISDRYFLSTLAFGSLEVDQEWLRQLNSKFLVPDITFLLKVSPEECLRRMKASREKLEFFEKLQTLKIVWLGYQKAAKKVRNVVIVNGERPPEIIAQEIFKLVKKKLSPLCHSER